MVSDNLYSLYPFEEGENLERLSVEQFENLLKGLLKSSSDQLKKINHIVKQRKIVTNQELEIENGRSLNMILFRLKQMMINRQGSGYYVI